MNFSSTTTSHSFFGSKLVYQLRTPEADAAVEESNLRRFDVPFGQFSFAYFGDAYEEKDI